jgi:hypothetical protein
MHIKQLKFDNVDLAFEYVNSNQLSSVYDQMISHKGEIIVILKFDSYSQYCFYSDKIGWTKLSVNEFLGYDA